MRKTILALAAGAPLAAGALLAAVPAWADDSTAALGAGGIVLVGGTPIRMVAEDLYLSPNQVRVRFAFVNPTAKDVETLVAFPLPDINTAMFWASGLGTVIDDPVNFVGFRVAVDGKPVEFKTEQRAFHKGRDVTALIAAAGAPVNPIANDGYRQLAGLATGKRNQLIAAGVAEGDINELVPRWMVLTKFYWTQRFPAHKTVVIEHSYQPVTGQAFTVPSEFDGEMENPYAKPFCMDAGATARVQAMIRAHKGGGPDELGPGMLNVSVTEYILKTAGNWNGPIGRFRLTLDKLKPENAISLCWDGKLKKTGPTTFEFVQTNFAPKQDIRLVVFE